jgi:hypothetical protein
MVLHGLAHDGQIHQKVSKVVLSLLLHPTAVSQPIIKMKQSNHGMSPGYTSSWSMVGMMHDDEMKL